MLSTDAGVEVGERNTCKNGRMGRYSLRPKGSFPFWTNNTEEIKIIICDASACMENAKWNLGKKCMNK